MRFVRSCAVSCGKDAVHREFTSVRQPAMGGCRTSVIRMDGMLALVRAGSVGMRGTRASNERGASFENERVIRSGASPVVSVKS
ncbi:hypothetical protein DF196_13025 [Bifidobacterium callitrichidarum]|uniref:Uncharacterized protein n=1 Tax=Bifidobacterium callitrichidarum TaxID=2052941 RepID=A0A2U2MYB8_9BIFI|nr:hypothetical protein DF196_13025 [Bifidobacterium callitrichidarum]